MTLSEFLARTDERLRRVIVKSNPYLTSWIYSKGRKFFIDRLSHEIPKHVYIPNANIKKVLWDIEFRTNLFNAAGMFKNAEGYYTAYLQGAGAYLAGTTTALERRGNRKNGITHPFAPYPFSGSASNWMGLPNFGNERIAKRISLIEKQPGCPIGISISADPSQQGIVALDGLVTGALLYTKAGVDFIEINESCPNVPHGIDNVGNMLNEELIMRLEYFRNNFLNKRIRNLPVIVKFSNDTNENQINDLVDLLIDLGYDGINFGNTSIDYNYYRTVISSEDIKQFDYFTTNFGGGLSGRILKNISLILCRKAVARVNTKVLPSEFHVIRTGGIENSQDICLSDKSGISLNQWFTGYFECYARYGHNLYKEIIN